MAEYTERTVQGPEGVVVTEVKATKNPLMSTMKKILPWVAIGVGLLLVAMVLRPYVMTGASVAPAPLADPNYGPGPAGTTLSGIPYYDQYQAQYAPRAQAQQLAANPEPLGLTHENAWPQVPVSIIKDGKNLYTECPQTCNGRVACTDRSAFNYDPNATCDCINCCVPRTYGCLDPKATTYNPFANTNDSRFCKYAVNVAPARVSPAAMDCVAQLQINPDAAGCTAPLGGCTDPNNSMYNPQANFNDGTCVYGGKLVAPAQVSAPSCASARAPLETGCLAPHDTQFLGGLKGCGDAWDLRTGYSRGATTY